MRNVLLAIVLVQIAAGTACLADGNGSTLPTLEEIVREATFSERRLLNLHVVSEVSSLRRMPQEEAWEPAPERMKVEAWYDGLRDSRARVEIRDEVSGWINGPAPYSRDSFSVGFDGTQGRIAHHMTGPSDEPFPARRGEILPDRPAMLGASTTPASGLAFSLYGYDDGRGKSLTEIFQQILSIGFPMDISREELLGVPCIRVSGKGNGVEETYWLDPARGMALIGYDRIELNEDGSRTASPSIRVTRLVEAGEGIWYPVEAYREEPEWSFEGDPMAGGMRRHATGATVRHIYKAELAVANDPDFKEDVFEVEFPPGYMIQDRRTGMIFPSGPDPETLSESLDKMVEDVRLLDATSQPSSAGTFAAPRQTDRPATTAPAEDQYRPSAMRWAGPVIGLVAVFAVAFGVAFRRKRRTIVVFLLFLAAWCFQGPAVAQSRPNSDVPYVSNCGVNLTYMALNLFHREMPMADVVAELGAGPAMVRNCSLGDMKGLFENHGLQVKGCKADTLEEACAFLKPGTAMILRKKYTLGHQDVGHFVMAWSGSRGVAVLDPPRAPRWITRESLSRDPLLDGFSGEFLTIADPTEQVLNGPRLVLDSGEIDLGAVPPTPRWVTGRIWLRNEGNRSLAIERIAANSCASCMAAPSERKVVLPGEHTYVDVQFDRSPLPVGEVIRAVRIFTNEPSQQPVLVTFRMTCLDQPRPADIRVIPAVVDYGRCPASAIAKRRTTIRLVVPAGRDKPEEVKPVTDAEQLSIVLDRDALSVPGLSLPGDHVFTYVLSWREPPTGPFDAAIRFEIPGEQNPPTLTVRGDGL
jgi:hypothetical protein